MVYDSFYRIIYWSDVGSNPQKIKKASMDGSGVRTVAFLNDTFLFTLDYSQQILYWIKFSTSSNCNNYTMESSRADGSERRTVYRAGDCYYYHLQAIDFFRGVICSYSRYHRNIFTTVMESGPNITYINHFMCCSWDRSMCISGMKVISLERQLEGIFH